uniref:Nanos homolog 1 n=1 Tax=Tetraodon nigroviridis TaxID=99883 RepID=H3CYX0_TETNG
SPYDYTFNFWNDYLGLSTLVAKILRPCGHLGGGESPSYGGALAGLDLLSADRRRKQSPRGKPEPRVCVFCRNNGAPEEVYGTHILKTADGRVLCPILRAYTCPLCSANGDNAHTIKYCPLSKDQAHQRAAKGGR